MRTCDVLTLVDAAENAVASCDLPWGHQPANLHRDHAHGEWDDLHTPTLAAIADGPGLSDQEEPRDG
jgi:hypothetical protein